MSNTNTQELRLPPDWQKKLDNLKRLAFSNYFGTKNRLELIVTIEEIQKESAQALHEQATEILNACGEIIGEDDKIDELDDVKKQYTAMDMELIAVQMRTKLRFEQKSKLKELQDKYIKEEKC